MNNENNDEFLPGVGPIDNNGTSNTPQNFDPNIPNFNPNETPFNMEPNQFDPNINNFDSNMSGAFDPSMEQVPFDMNQPNMDPNMNNGFDTNMNGTFAPNMNNSFDPNINNNFDPNMNNSFDPNLNNNFDPNTNVGFEPNQFDPNMGQVPFDMNQPNMDPNMNNGFDTNMNGAFDPSMNNNFDYNMNNSFDSSLNNNFDPNANVGFEQNQFDPNMGQAPFDMNQPNMNNSFDPSINNNFDPNMNNGFTPNMNGDAFDPNMNNNFDPNMGNGFDANMNTNFDNNFDQADSSDYSEDFERNWMGTIYDKAHSKKFNFCAAFFGPAYLFYRKVYLTGGLTTLILIIINIIISLLKLTNIGLVLGINAIIMLIYFFGLGFGFYPIYRDFVHKQFNKYKKQITDNNQLVAIASKKGGSSILSLIIYYLAAGVVSTVMVYAIFASLLTGLVGKLPQQNITNNNTITNNTILPEEPDEESFVFAPGYSLNYPDSTWVVSADKKSLIKGAYTLTYTVTYQASDLGVTDMISNENRTTLLTIINNSVTNLAVTNNLQMDPPNDNFVSSNGSYYTYINLSSDTEVTRYYFVIIPDEEKLFQFELKINDTTVTPETHLEVVKMITQITTDSNNTLTGGNTTTNDTLTDNSVSNTVANNAVSNEVSNNVVSGNTNTSSVSNVLRNTSI